MAANYYKYNATMGDRTYFTSVVNTSSGSAKRYFSNIESEIYFGNKEMEDIYQFEFGIDEKILPIYGYNCFYATELVSGQRIVQGQFVVNYTDSKMIQSVLGSIEDSVYREISDEDYFPGGDLHHAIYDKQFDIMIGYGYYNVKDKHTYNATSQTIIGAKISGMHKVLDTTGQPILEVFTFMAKDFIEENITEASTGKAEEPKKEETKKEPNKTQYAYVCSNETNATEREANLKIAKNNNCDHIVHSLYFHEGLIKLSIYAERVSTSNKADIKKFSLIEGALEINDKLSDTVVVPVFNFTSVAESSATIQLEAKFFTLLLENEEKYNGKINCTLRYVCEIESDNGTMEKKTIIYDGAVLCL